MPNKWYLKAMLFEGPEKKIEIVLRDSHPSIRDFQSDKWNRVVAASKAEILSSISNGYMDAYLLSESSLFVNEKQIVMITCGRTNLLSALDEILSFVDPAQVAHLFYERKRFMFPQSQQSDFEKDVSHIEHLFSGRSYRFGAANKDHLHLYYCCEDPKIVQTDATIEILMHGLDADVIAACSSANVRTKENLRLKLDISRITDSLGRVVALDDYLFQPEGYSLNALYDNAYATIHITPQSCDPQRSYASFETNMAPLDYDKVVPYIAQVFRPRQLMMFITYSKDMETTPSLLKGFNRVESCNYQFNNGYNALYQYYKLLSE